MSASDAATAQGMATRHKRSVKAVVAGVGEINALLAKIEVKRKMRNAISERILRKTPA